MFNKIKNFFDNELVCAIILVIILIAGAIFSGVTGEMYHV